MKLSLDWLKSCVEQIANWEEILEKLTMAGIEVENIISMDKDKVVEFKITPNRGDCLSVYGLLREIAALVSEVVVKKEFDNTYKVVSQIPDKIKINLIAKELCPNYAGLVIKGLNNQVQTPQYILDRLGKSGIRAITAIVDITNYVMLELGQPLHAFDLNKVGETIQIRLANDHEKIKLLDGKDVNLLSDTLIIANSKDEPIAIAGVMGGMDSSVIELTNNIVLESAFFIPDIITGVSKTYGVNSESAYRYERGVDYKLQYLAINYAAKLIQEICGGKIGEIAQATSEYMPKVKYISLEHKLINKVIGEDINLEIIRKILVKLGFKILDNSDNIINVEVPSFRFDIKIKEDIIEEIARVYGYDNIKPKMPVAAYNIKSIDRLQLKINSLKNILVKEGYNEIISYAFHEESYAKILGEYNEKTPNLPIKLQNPIAGLSVMRMNLMTDLLKALIHNVNRGHTSIRLFEVARVFHGETKEAQPIKIAGLIYGDFFEKSWANKAREVDFFDIKHDVELLLEGQSHIKFEPVTNYLYFHGGRTSKIYWNNEEIGVLGQLHPQVGYKIGLVTMPYLFELDVNYLLNFINCVKIRPISKFPKVYRDLSFVVKDNVAVGLIITAIKNADIKYLIDLQIVDVYQGANLESNYKSVTLNFIFQSDKTLIEEEINKDLQIITKLIEEKFHAVLRKE